MFVRLAFSVAIHVEPEILVVDEALSVGDARFAAKCMRRIRDMRESGVTLLFVSHDISSVRAVCDRALWLSDGTTRMLGSVFEVTAHYMEYLFEDEIAVDAAAEPDTPETGTPDAVAVEAQEPEQPVAALEESNACKNPAAATTVDAPAIEGDRGPLANRVDGIINHWGSHVGCVRGLRFSGEGGSSAVIKYGETVTLEVNLEIPDAFPKETLSLAFSIKDLRGTDLLVCTTHDENPGLFIGSSQMVTVRFEFINRLSPGKFLLAVALEDRFSPSISYYEYIEGAAYFASIAEIDRFGVFNLPVGVTLLGG